MVIAGCGAAIGSAFVFKSMVFAVLLIPAVGGAIYGMRWVVTGIDLKDSVLVIRHTLWPDQCIELRGALIRNVPFSNMAVSIRDTSGKEVKIVACLENLMGLLERLERVDGVRYELDDGRDRKSVV